MELIMAMPPAAAVPRSMVVGKAQNGPKQPQIPAAASENAAMASQGLANHALNAKPIIAPRRLITRCHRRSCFRSELRAIHSMATVAARYGIAVSKMTGESEAWDICFNTTGSHRLRL